METRGHSRSRRSTSVTTSGVVSATASMYRSHSPSSDYTAAVQVLSRQFFRSERERIVSGDEGEEEQ